LNEQLQRDLLDRSLELRFPWCCLFPSQARNFLKKGWVLVIDDRRPPERHLFTIPPENLAKLTFPRVKPRRRKKKA